MIGLGDVLIPTRRRRRVDPWALVLPASMLASAALWGWLIWWLL